MDCVTWQIFWGFFGLLVGGYMGHRLGLMRDWRKEINELSDKLSGIVDAQLRSPSPFRGISDDDLRLYRRMLPWWKKRRFDRIRKQYEEATGEENRVYELLDVKYADEQKVQNVAKKFIKWFPRH